MTFTIAKIHTVVFGNVICMYLSDQTKTKTKDSWIRSDWNCEMWEMGDIGNGLVV